MTATRDRIDLSDLWTTPGLIEAVLRDLGLDPRQQSGRWVVSCPRCDKREAHIRPPRGHAPMLFCNRRNACGFEGSLFAELVRDAGGEREAFARLEALAGRPAPDSVSANLREQTRPLRAELASFWKEARPVDADGRDSDASRLLRSKGIDAEDLAPLGLAKLAPGIGFSWWPTLWSATWRLIVPAFDAIGNFVSLHARAVVEGSDPKTRWPRGCSASGLFFADRAGRLVLRSDPEIAGELEAVVVVEGLTDTLATALWASRTASPIPVEGWTGSGPLPGPRFAVIGISAGLDVSAVAWPRRLPVLIATDEDPAGDQYAAKIMAGLPAGVMAARSSLREVCGG